MGKKAQMSSHPSHEIQLQLVRITCTTNQEVQIKMILDTLFLPM